MDWHDSCLFGLWARLSYFVKKVEYMRALLRRITVLFISWTVTQTLFTSMKLVTMTTHISHELPAQLNLVLGGGICNMQSTSEREKQLMFSVRSTSWACKLILGADVTTCGSFSYWTCATVVAAVGGCFPPAQQISSHMKRWRAKLGNHTICVFMLQQSWGQEMLKA